MNRLSWYVAVFILTACSAPLPDTDWSIYLGNSNRSSFSPLQQIDRSNVHKLERVWVYDSGDLQEGASVMHTSPLVIDGRLYGLSPRLSPFAIDASNGQELWHRTDITNTKLSTQKSLLWLDQNDSQQLVHIADSQLIGINPQNGKTSFTIDLTTSKLSDASVNDSPGLILDDLIIVGIGKNILATNTNGEIVWKIDTQAQIGGISADEGRGWIYLSTDSPDPPHNKSNRKNGYANSILAVDARTGEIQWTFSNIVNDLWDRGFKTPPTLIGDTFVGIAASTGHLFLLDRNNGKPLIPLQKMEAPASALAKGDDSFQWSSSIELTRQTFEITNRSERAGKLVTESLQGVDVSQLALPSSQGALLFPGYNADSGWGIAHNPKTNFLFINAQETAGIVKLLQIPAGFSEQDEYMQHCARCHGVDRKGLYSGREERYGAGGPSLINVQERLSALDIDTAIRLGRGSMPEIDRVNEISRKAIVNYLLTGDDDLTTNPRTTQTEYIFSGQKTIRDSDGLPGNASPWGTLTAFDTNGKQVRWQVPLGDYPGYTNRDWGAENIGSPLATESGLVFMAGTPDMKIRAFDSDDGSILWEADLPVAGYSAPITYSVKGKQYLVIGAGGGALGPPSGSEYIAFSLP